jgi:SAF domain-containing protein
MKRWVTALLALAVGGGVSAALLVLTNPDRDAVDVYAATRDIRAGSTLAPDSVVLVRVSASGLPPLIFRRGDGPRLATLLATHDLTAGQLIQRSDARSGDSIADRRLVFIPVKDAPPVVPGSKVDLLVIDGPLDHVSVSPFALGVEVNASAPGGLVLVVSSKQAPAFVYASIVLRLTAVTAEPGTAAGAEGAVSTAEQAVTVAGEP